MKFFFRKLIPRLSLAVAVIAVALAAHSYRHDDKWEFSTLRAHFTVWSKRGAIIVMGPPPATWNPTEARAWDNLKRLENQQFRFIITPATARTNDSALDIESQPIPGTAAAELAAVPQSLIMRPLLRGLDGPKKFAAADLLLEGQGGEVIVSNTAAKSSQTDAAIHFGGYTLRPSKPSGENDASSPGATTQSTQILDSKAENPPFVDPAQRDIRRRYWHDRLDVQMFKLSYFWIVIGNLLLSSIHFIRRRALLQKVDAAVI